MNESKQAWWSFDGGFGAWSSLLFGVLLPAVAIGFEGSVGLLGDLVTSPMPTMAHTALMVLVVVSNLLTLVAGPRLVGRLRIPNGLAVGIAATYAVLFVPLIPLSLLGIMVAGIGLLGFAPFGALAAAIYGRRRLRRVLTAELEVDWSEASYRHAPALPTVARARLLPVLAGPLLLMGLELPGWLTLAAIEDARSPENEVAEVGIRRLRQWGDRDLLAQACVGHGRAVGGLTGLLANDQLPAREELQAIHYRAYGVPCPAIGARGPQFAGGARGRPTLDRDQGSDRIGAVQPELRLVDSAIDGSIDGEGLVGYAEWTLRFANRGSFNGEARALVELPPGGVVSRATLWIDGEPREAAFGAEAAVEEAYRSVVRRSRDPLLVTHAGPDRVLLQCFPVAPDGGEMQVRIGVSFPLPLEREGRAEVPMPRLLARNFVLEGNLQHRVWLDSKQWMYVDGGEGRSDGSRLILKPEAVEGSTHHLTVLHDPAITTAWSSDAHDAEVVTEQRIEHVATTPPQRLVVVVDTSRSMAGAAEWLPGILDVVPEGIAAGLVLVGDGPPGLPILEPMSTAVSDRWREALHGASWEGGRDNVPALKAALTVARGGTVLWIHGAQPMILQAPAGIGQIWERDAESQLLHLQVGLGDDQVVGALGRWPQLRAVPRTGSASEDLRRLLARWGGHEPTYRRTLTRVGKPRGAGHRTSDHLTRLWAAQQVTATMGDDREVATGLAVQHQLVTPVSGAVVLETADQYDAAGLEPVDPETVASVPEPETWALMICAAAMMLAWSRRKHWGVA